MIENGRKIEIYENLVKLNGIEAKTFQTIHSGCDIETFRPFRAQAPTIWVHRCKVHSVASAQFAIGNNRGQGVSQG